ncbi:transketolase [Candidatus Gottesmanbacteria bacterium RBG_16_52_11]|uniref:Transketolase n=1 Tax=Candidatus Gottesmanbacteria bacterium RBG_16_52_11 TaxID=1798374 RepID=A0A1F5YWM0_9BACT|nr:MAG: transketolase [Candidatus Gottesmanbacteria bacterium RBG_16_52_11]
MRKTSLEQVYLLAKKDKRVVFVGSDLGHGTLDKFKAEMPDRFFMEGVSEQHLTGMLAGMALSGKVPYFNTIAVFAYRRCLEQVILDVAIPNLPVRIIASGGGFVYVPLGPTHLATDDLAILRTVPNMTVIAPADAAEMARLMPLTLNWPGPIYIRLAKGGDPVVTPADVPFRIGKAVPVATGSDLLIITTGITLQFALVARKMLAAEGIKAGVLHVPTVKPLDQDGILSRIAKVRGVVTIEEGVRLGGLGSAIGELMLDEGLVRPLTRIGLPDEFTLHYGTQLEQLAYYGISGDGIVRAARKLLGGRVRTRTLAHAARRKLLRVRPQPSTQVQRGTSRRA